MGMPEIPHTQNVKVDLWESITLEEAALAAILNAEADKLKAGEEKALELPLSVRMVSTRSS